jgi:hypothetical protein
MKTNSITELYTYNFDNKQFQNVLFIFNKSYENFKQLNQEKEFTKYNIVVNFLRIYFGMIKDISLEQELNEVINLINNYLNNNILNNKDLNILRENEIFKNHILSQYLHDDIDCNLYIKEILFTIYNSLKRLKEKQ